MLIPIAVENLSELKLKAGQSPRKRMNYNFHREPEDTFQRMLHVLNVGTYIQPHKHENPDKREVFIILQGRAAVLEFDDTGNVTGSVFLDHNKGNYGVEVPSRTWHTMIALDNNTVVYEAKDGPYSPSSDKNFAPWAPREGEPLCSEYIEILLSKINGDI